MKCHFCSKPLVEGKCPNCKLDQPKNDGLVSYSAGGPRVPDTRTQDQKDDAKTFLDYLYTKEWGTEEERKALQRGRHYVDTVVPTPEDMSKASIVFMSVLGREGIF